MPTREWFSLTELLELALPGMPESRTGYTDWAARKGWDAPALDGIKRRPRPGRGGGVEYHYSLLPMWAVAAIAQRFGDAPAPRVDAARAELQRAELHAWFDRQTEKKKAKAREALALLQAVAAARRAGVPKVQAVQLCCQQAGVSASAYYTLEKRVAGLDAADWLPALAPRHAGAAQAEAECSPEAWAWLKADFLRPEKPSFTACYRRLLRQAGIEGWSVPAQRTLERRMYAPELASVLVQMREGREALERLFPSQQRDRGLFHALEAVNSDAHTFDVFVRWSDRVVARPSMYAIQDLYSGMILAWRIDRSENTQAIRLAIGDVIEEFGIPKHFWFDNTRAAANKAITGGAKSRFRFKIKEEDPEGLISLLGAEVHFTTPYHGQAKPIERAFRDVAGEWAKDPRFASAYTGANPMAKPENYGSGAVPLEKFIATVGELVEEHNTRTGRRAAVCAGRSFRATFDESYAEAAERGLIRKGTAEQRRLWLLQAEPMKIRADAPMLHLAENRYWAEWMIALRGTSVVARFDADALHEGVHCYHNDGRYIGFAECVAAVGFNDMAAAREQARKRRAFMRAHRALADAELRGMSIEQLAAAMEARERAVPAPAPETKVVRGVFATSGANALKPAATAELDDDLSPEQQARKAAALLAFPPRPRAAE